uniref:Uncharacterized protein n=1 Tax=Brassica oleracea var. oleracea TaxID=109376 RepID=A0A0D3CFG7_BRAOL
MVLIFYKFKDDFHEVQTTSWKSSGLPGRHLDFMEVFNQMVHIFHSFKNLEDFWDDLPVSRLKYNALDDFHFIRLDFLKVVWTSWKSSGLPGSRLNFLEVVWTS